LDEKLLKRALKIKILIGVLIILSPVFITGKWFMYDIVNDLLVARVGNAYVCYDNWLICYLR